MNEPEHLTGFADVVAVTTDNGELRVRVGDVGLEQGFADRIPVYGPDGFIGIPNLPGDDGKAAQAIYFYDGNRKICIGTRDNRFAANIGTGKPGDRMIVTDGNARFLIKQEKDSVTLYTINSLVDQDMMVSLDGSTGQMLFQNGGTFFKMLKDAIEFAINGGPTFRMSADGIQMTGGACDIICGLVRLGDQGNGLPALPASPVAITQAGPVNTTSTKVFAAT